MFKKCKFNVGLTLLVQSVSFVILFFMLYSKKRNLANTFLALSAIGGIAGAYLVLKEAKNEVEACEQAAKDACDNGENTDDSFDFDECENCYGDCNECSGKPKDASNCTITVEENNDADEENTDNGAEAKETAEPDESTESDASQEEAQGDLVEEEVKEEPAEDVFTENAPQEEAAPQA